MGVFSSIKVKAGSIPSTERERVRRERKERERIEVEEGKEKMEIQLRNTRPCVVKILLIASRQLTAQKRMSS